MSDRQELVYEREIRVSKDVSSGVGDTTIRVRRGPPDIISDWRVTVETVTYQFINREDAVEQAVARVAEIVPLIKEAGDGDKD